MKRPRKKLLVALLAVVAASVAGGFYLKRPKPTPVRVARTEHLEELKALVNGSGEIRTEDSVDVQTEIAGVIIELPVREGDHVKKGQRLLRIDPFQTETDVLSARSMLDALLVEAKGQEFQIATSEANAARDEFLKKSAEFELRQSEANQTRAAAQLRREKDLLAENLISADQFEISETTVKLTQAGVEAAGARIKQLDAQIKAAQANIEYARASRDAILKRVNGARSSLLRTEDLLKKTEIRSTLDGVIVKLNVEVGERAVPGLLTNPQATLMTIADFAIIEAELKVDETDIVTVKLGDPARVVVDALPDTPLAGSIVEIGNSPILNVSGSSAQEGKDFKVVVRIENPPEMLRPGMSCEADITTSVKHNVLVVPIQALTVREAKVDLEGKYIAMADEKDAGPGVVSAAGEPREQMKELQGVFLLGDEGRSRFRAVKTGILGEMDIEVLDGLEPGDKVIVGPLKALRTLKENDLVTEDLEHPFRRTLRKRAEEGEEGEP